MRRLFVAALLMVGSSMAALPKDATTPAATPQPAVVHLQDVNVKGYLDNPSSILVSAGSIESTSRMSLERSFADAIQGNVDRETVEWRNGETR